MPRKPLYGRMTLLALGLLALPALFSSVAGAITLTSNNIPGGWVRRVVEAPTAPGTYYAASWSVFKSTDFGRTWVSKPYPMPTDVDGTHFPRHNTWNIAVCPHDPNTVITGDQNETPVWRCTDGAVSTASWTSVLLENDNQRRAVTMVSFSITNTTRCFAAGRVNPDVTSHQEHILYTSADTGATWSKTALTTTVDQTIMDAAQVPIGTGRLVVAVIDKYYSFVGDGYPATTGKICISDDNGATFLSSMTVTLGWAPYKFTWDPTHNRLWAVSSGGAIYSSADGIAWTFEKQMITPAAQGGAQPIYFYKIIYTVCGGTPMLFATASGYGDAGQMVYKSSSTDFSAASWHASDYAHGDGQKLNGSIYDVVADTRDATGNTWGVGIANSGFFITTDDGAHVAQSPGINTRSISYGVRHGNQIIVNTFGNMSYASMDAGATWMQAHPSIDSYAGGVSPKYFAINPADPAKVFMTSDYSLYLSTASGMGSFNRISITAPSYTYVPGSPTDHFPYYTNILIHPSSPTVMFMGVMTGKGYAMDNYLLKSENAGSTWTKVPGLISHGIAAIAFDPLNPDIMYASCGSGCRLGGTTGTMDGLWKSTDAAVTWTQIGKGIFERGFIETFTFDPEDSSTLWTGGVYPNNGGAVHISTDAGKNWKSQLMNGNVIYNSRIFYFKPYLYFGTSEGFLYKSDDRGKTWGIAMMLPAEISWLINDSTGTSSGSMLRRAIGQAGSLYTGSGNGLYLVTGLNAASGITGGYGNPFAGDGGGIGDSDNIRAYTGNDIKVFTYPNPFNPASGLMTIRLGLARDASRINVKLYSLSGELVIDSDLPARTGGTYYGLTWDGKNQEGTLCAPGLYFLVADVDGSKVRYKVVLVY